MKKLPLTKEFLSHLNRKKYSEETVYNYKRDLKTFLNFLNKKNIKFENINKENIDDYKNYLLSFERRTSENKDSIKQLSHYSINRMLSALRAYLRYLIDSGYVPPLLVESIKLLKSPKRIINYAKTDDIVKLIESPTILEKNKKVALRNRAMLETLFSTGLRLFELLNLKRDQINKSGQIFIKDKNEKGRFVYLAHRTQKHLANYLDTRTDSSPFAFVPYSGSRTKDKNKKICPEYLQRKIKQYREILGIETPISAQWLTTDGFTNYLIEQNLNPEPIKTISVHESINLLGPMRP